jgi:hypothetical protein
MTDKTSTQNPTIDELLAQVEANVEQIERLNRRVNYFERKPRGKYSESIPTDRQVQALCVGFLSTKKGRRFDAITAGTSSVTPSTR